MNVRKLSKFGFAILALGTCMANAQTELAHVSGRVTDQSGAAVADAEVEIRNVDTNLSTTVKTNHDALYTFPSLRPGHYKLSARKPKPKSSV